MTICVKLPFHSPELCPETQWSEETCFPTSMSASQVNRGVSASSASACVPLKCSRLAYKSIFKTPAALPASTVFLLRMFHAPWAHLVIDPGFETDSCELWGKWYGKSCHALKNFKESLCEQVVIHDSYIDKNTVCYPLSPFRPHGFCITIYIIIQMYVYLILYKYLQYKNRMYLSLFRLIIILYLIIY